MLISCHISLCPLLSTKAFTPAGGARAIDTLALSLVPWQSKRKLPLKSVVSSYLCCHQGSTAVAKLPIQGGKNKVICECMSLPNVLGVCWVKEEHDP